MNNLKPRAKIGDVVTPSNSGELKSHVHEWRTFKRENGEIVLCSACDKYIALDGYCFCPVGQAMKVLYEKGIIKDGKIVNL